MADINDQCFGGVAPGLGWGDGLTPTLATSLQWNAAGGGVGNEPPGQSLDSMTDRLSHSGSGLTRTASGVASDVDGFSAKRRARFGTGGRAGFRGGREGVEGDPAGEPLSAWAVVFVVIVALIVLGGLGFLAYAKIQADAAMFDANPEALLGLEAVRAADDILGRP